MAGPFFFFLRTAVSHSIFHPYNPTLADLASWEGYTSPEVRRLILLQYSCVVMGWKGPGGNKGRKLSAEGWDVPNPLRSWTVYTVFSDFDLHLATEKESGQWEKQTGAACSGSCGHAETSQFCPDMLGARWVLMGKQCSDSIGFGKDALASWSRD